MGPRLKLWHHREGPGLGNEDIVHGDVVAPRPAHPHNIPCIDDLAPFLREVDHPHLGIAVGMLVGIYKDCRRDPVGVEAVADERRSAGDAVTPIGRCRLERAAELGGDQDVGATAVDLLCPLVRESGAEESPV